MKIAAVLLAVFATVATLSGEQTTTSAEEKKPPTMVDAAKAAGGPKKKRHSKVITNSDLKKSRGKLIEKPAGKDDAPPAAPAPMTEEQYQQHRRSVQAAEARVDAAQEQVAGLEKELSRLEQAYYDEADPVYRDTTLTARFNQTRTQLDTARKALADAQDALNALGAK